MRRLGWVLGFGLAGVGLGWGQAPLAGVRTTQTKADAGGVVVNARTGAAIAGATVTVSGVGGGATVATTRADGEGRFAVRGLARGKYALRAEARGFVGAAYQEHEEFSTAIAVGTGLETEGLRLELKPEAALRGRVTDEAGDGVRDARVTIYRETRGMGRREVVSATTTTTDDQGEYEAGPLREGRYFVAVSGRPWWAMYPRGDGAGSAGAAAAAGGTTGVDSALDVAYPLTFAPGVTDSRRAVGVEVKAGEVARADVALVPVRAVTLTMRRSSGGEGPTPGVMLRVPAFSGSEMVAGEMEFGRGSVAVHGLAPGDYQMQTMGGDEREARVTVGEGGAEVTEATGEALWTVEAKVTEVGGGELPGGVVVQLRQQGAETGEEERGHTGGVRENGEARVRGVPEGSYRVLAFDGEGPVTVERLEVGGKEIRNGALAVGDGTTEVEVTVGPAAKGVDGVVERGGKPVSGAMVVLVPVDAMGVPAMYRRDQSDQDGTFTLRGVVEGRYIVVAVEDGWGLDWSRRGVMERYLAKGVAVEVKAGVRGVVKVPGAVEAQGK